MKLPELLSEKVLPILLKTLTRIPKSEVMKAEGGKKSSFVRYLPS